MVLLELKRLRNFICMVNLNLIVNMNLMLIITSFITRIYMLAHKESMLYIQVFHGGMLKLNIHQSLKYMIG